MKEDFIKVTSEAYRILDFLPDGDPLKNKAKEKVLAILDCLTLILKDHGWLSLKDYFSVEMEKAKEGLLRDIEVLENYLSVAKNQGWIDSLNFLIITKEYQNIKKPN